MPPARRCAPGESPILPSTLSRRSPRPGLPALWHHTASLLCNSCGRMLRARRRIIAESSRSPAAPGRRGGTIDEADPIPTAGLFPCFSGGRSRILKPFRHARSECGSTRASALDLVLTLRSDFVCRLLEIAHCAAGSFVQRNLRRPPQYSLRLADIQINLFDLARPSCDVLCS